MPFVVPRRPWEPAGTGLILEPGPGSIALAPQDGRAAVESGMMRE